MKYRFYTGITVYFLKDWFATYLWIPDRAHWRQSERVYVTDDYGSLVRVR